MGRAVISRNDVAALAAAAPEPAPAAGLAVAVVPGVALAGGQPTPEPDMYRTRLFKYIPGEVITLYVTLSTLVQSASSEARGLDWLIFVVGIVATPTYLWKLQGVRKWGQLIISTLAFLVWVFALGGPFKQPPLSEWYKPVYGAIVLVIYTFFIPVFGA